MELRSRLLFQWRRDFPMVLVDLVFVSGDKEDGGLVEAGVWLERRGNEGDER